MKHIYKMTFVAFLLMAGCSTSRITSSWKASNLQPKKYNKILVLGLIREPDRMVREKMEEHLVGDLKDLGYNAVCSCEEFSSKTFENVNEQEAIRKLNGGGIDAVLTIVLLDKSKERYYIPDRVYYSPYYMYHNRFWGYYTTMNDRIHSPGYYAVDTKYFWESNFYDLSNRELLYSVQSQSFSPESTVSLAHEYGQMIVKDMVKSNVISVQSTGALKAY